MFFKNLIVIETPGDLLRAAEEYFQWADNHPILTEKVAVNKGDVIRYDEQKVRAVSIGGLAVRMGYTERSLRQLCKTSTEMASVLERIEDAIRTQRLEHGHAGTLNAQMAMRELGMVDRTESVQTSIKMEFEGAALDDELKRRGLNLSFLKDVFEGVEYEEVDQGRIGAAGSESSRDSPG